MSYQARAKKLLEKYCNENNLDFSKYIIEDCASFEENIFPENEETSFEVFEVDDKGNKHLKKEIYIYLDNDKKLSLKDGINSVCEE